MLPQLILIVTLLTLPQAPVKKSPLTAEESAAVSQMRDLSEEWFATRLHRIGMGTRPGHHLTTAEEQTRASKDATLNIEYTQKALPLIKQNAALCTRLTVAVKGEPCPEVFSSSQTVVTFIEFKEAVKFLDSLIGTLSK